jgi:hypothetical protein
VVNVLVGDTDSCSKCSRALTFESSLMPGGRSKTVVKRIL